MTARKYDPTMRELMAHLETYRTWKALTKAQAEGRLTHDAHRNEYQEFMDADRILKASGFWRASDEVIQAFDTLVGLFGV